MRRPIRILTPAHNVMLFAVFVLICLTCGFQPYASAQTPTSNSEATTKKKPRGWVTVATIGSKQAVANETTDPQRMVDQVIAHWQRLFDQVLPDKPDLIVVPEACDRPTGISEEKSTEYYAVRKNQVRDFFAEVARENHCYIIYSARRLTDDGTWRNSSVMLDRTGGTAGIYNKNCPTIGEMNSGIVCGNNTPVVECDFGRVAMAICFDLNFDEVRLKYVAAKPDLIAFSSMYHGGLMQQYWAYSCRCHFVGAITGRDKPSQIRNPLGDPIVSNTNYFDCAVAKINLDCELVHLDENWGRLRAMKAKYGPEVKITDPGQLGAVLIASEHETLSIDEMIKEFQLERLDDYLVRSLAHRQMPGNTAK